MSSLVDIRDYVNKELALRIHTAIDSQGTFFTDLNGFQVIAGPRARRLHRAGLGSCFASVTGTKGWSVLIRKNQARAVRKGLLQVWDPLGAKYVCVKGAGVLDLLALTHRCSPGGI